MNDLAGQRFGRLVVIREAERKNRAVMWQCQCDCGNKTVVQSPSLRHGLTKSCGCYQRERGREVAIKRNTTHGFSYHPIYSLWNGIIDRCYNPKDKHYKDYGGRGIKVCPEWRDSPKQFIEWAEANGWQKDLEIDRIDNDKGYSPGNCRFATRSEQMLNSRLLHSTNTSGFRGVCWHKHKKGYIARVYLNRKQHQLGVFPSAIEAAKARDLFVIERELHSPLNFPLLLKG